MLLERILGDPKGPYVANLNDCLKLFGAQYFLVDSR